MTTDFTSMILSMREKLNIPILIGILASVITAFFLGWVFWLVAAILVVFITFINGMYVIMPGYAGYKITLGAMENKSFSAGFGWMMPFISSMSEVDITRQRHEDTNKMKNRERRDIALTYVLTWNLNPHYVHVLHATIGESDYISKALCPQLDAAFSEVVAEKTYEDINGKLADLSSEVKNNFEPRYDHNLFENVELNIINVQFDKDYEDAVSEMAKVEMQRKIVEEKSEQLKISTQAQAEARQMEADGEAAYVRKMAEAEAEAMKVKGASENEVREKLGEIYQARPELIQELLAKNFPKVYGGGNVTPMMDLGELLGNKPATA